MILLQLEQNKEWTMGFDYKMIFIEQAKYPSYINLFFYRPPLPIVYIQSTQNSE